MKRIFLFLVLVLVLACNAWGGSTYNSTFMTGSGYATQYLESYTNCGGTTHWIGHADSSSYSHFSYLEFFDLNNDSNYSDPSKVIDSCRLKIYVNDHTNNFGSGTITWYIHYINSSYGGYTDCSDVSYANCGRMNSNYHTIGNVTFNLFDSGGLGFNEFDCAYALSDIRNKSEDSVRFETSYYAFNEPYGYGYLTYRAPYYADKDYTPILEVNYTDSELSLNVSSPANDSFNLFPVTLLATVYGSELGDIEVWFYDLDEDELICSGNYSNGSTAFCVWDKSFTWDMVYNWSVNLSQESQKLASGTYNFSTPLLTCESTGSGELEVCCSLSGVPDSDDGYTWLEYCDLDTYDCVDVPQSSTWISPNNLCFGQDNGLYPGNSYSFQALYDASEVYGNQVNFSFYECYENDTPTGCPAGYSCQVNTCVLDNQSYNSSNGSYRLVISDIGNVSRFYTSTIYAYYLDDSDNVIPGVTCSFSSVGFEPSFGYMDPMYIDFEVTGYYAHIMIGNYSGTKYYVVTCSKTGYPTLQANDSFYVYSSDSKPTSLTWQSPGPAAETGQTVVFRVLYETTTGESISGASCNVLVGVNNYSMTDLGGGVYRYSKVFGSEGYYNYLASCHKSGYMSKDSDIETIIIYESSAGTTTTTLYEPYHCLNGYKDSDETDEDCGGSCDPCPNYWLCLIDSDCVSGYCGPSGVCLSPTCYDGVRNGDETAVDCGGSCDPCGCFQNWDCASDGSEHCNSSSMECVIDRCNVSSDCASLIWKDWESGTIYSRSRICLDTYCKFGSENITSGDISMIIIPGTSVIWNDSSRRVYVSNCEDKTNFFTVKTDEPTIKYFYHTDPVYYAPYVNLSSNIEFGSYASESTRVISGLCEIPRGSNRVYSLIVFQASDGGADWVQDSVYTLTFREAFEVNASLNATDVIEIRMNRNASCFYRSSSADSWELITPGVHDLILWNVSTSNEMYNIRCNDSFGEFASDTFNGGAHGLVTFAWYVVTLFLGTVYYDLTGSYFVWHDWYILLIFILLLFVLPTLLLTKVMLSRYRFYRRDQGL